MKTANVQIGGESPLLFDRPTLEEIEGSGLKNRGQKLSIPIEERLHKNGQGAFIPFEWIDRSLKNTSKTVIERGKTSYYKSISGAVKTVPDEIPFTPQKWVVFKHIVRRKDGNRIPKENPMFENWTADFQFLIDDWFDANVVREILIKAGKTEGIGAWRVACGGRFGKFTVEKFEVN